MATTATPWCGSGNDKLFLQSGQFTSTIKDSQSVSSFAASVRDISYDKTDTPWIGNDTGGTADKLFL